MTTTSYTWAQRPIPLIRTPLSLNPTPTPDQFTFAATEMSNVHNCIIRAFNSIYLQAPHIPPSHHTPFINYMLAAYTGLKAHHEGEESFFFPELERITGEKDLMDANISQHADFHSGFEAFGKWLQELKNGREIYDGDKCVRLLDAFIGPLSSHLNDEISTILQLSKYGDLLDLRKLGKAEGDKVMGTLNKTTQLPVFFLNHDLTYENGLHASFPPIPGVVTWVLREGFARWNASWWQFATCGFDGRPRELPFLGQKS
ncbi:hypothetical protein M011DRAFT_475018 [Sporormia fimetaria CBS 119925]|uniref:Hemerythrin-like domain-containing protein n=1 Tax=Sporormia fimetaria CBS 119925 TaxID=1340428 RepID=A0A6A6VIM2_9PLEO|nr:hypothetical protein M011DRAFT_475018 [Sporormia fimetaria CBS 119925]